MKATIPSTEIEIQPRSKEWKLYMFGSDIDKAGIVFTPAEGYKPNLFVRIMCRVFFDCKWVSERIK